MPLHPLGLAVLGTLAVVGTGVAFKKLIYDVHLAPTIEAYIAHLREQAQAAGLESRQPVPISLHSRHSSRHTPDRDSQHSRRLSHGQKYDRDEAIAARVTGRDVGYATGSGAGVSPTLRRRSHRAHSDESNGKGEGYWDGERSGRNHEDRFGDQEHLLHRPSKETIDRSQSIYPLPRPPYRQPSHSHTNPNAEPLIDLEAVSPQDAEIRSVIFNYPASSIPSTPARSRQLSRRPSVEGLSAMAMGGLATLRPIDAYPAQLPSPSPIPDLDYPDDRQNQHLDPAHPALHPGYPQASTTFSFLSLSDAESPAVPHSMLASWSSLREREREDDNPLDRAGGSEADVAELIDRDEIRSIASDVPSSYADAETYSPVSALGSGAQSPRLPAFPSVPITNLAQNPATSQAINPDPSVADELGLTFAQVQLPRHGQLSLAALQQAAMQQDQEREIGVRRGPMSVISVSESETSAWEAV